MYHLKCFYIFLKELVLAIKKQGPWRGLNPWPSDTAHAWTSHLPYLICYFPQSSKRLNLWTGCDQLDHMITLSPTIKYIIKDTFLDKRFNLNNMYNFIYLAQNNYFIYIWKLNFMKILILWRMLNMLCTCMLYWYST